MNILENDIAISSPADLAEVLRDVKAYLAQGRLRQLLDAGNPLVSRTRLSDISEHGPWPDYFEALFEDDRGYRYRLSVETYHGIGGSWGRT